MKYFALILSFFAVAFAQAQYFTKPLHNDMSDLPRVEVKIYDSAILGQHLSIAFTTSDVRMASGKPFTDPSSFQIISASRPFPPEVFALSDLGEGKPDKHYFFQDFRVQHKGLSSIYVNFHDSFTSINGYLILRQDAKGRFSVIDTFGQCAGRSVDAHSFIIDEKGYYWFITNPRHKYDMSHRTQNKIDTAASVVTTRVQVWDPVSRKEIFGLDLWDKGLVPIDSIPMDVIETHNENQTYDITHANGWVPLGNIDGCDIGILSDLMDGVKFIRLCDSTVMRYGASSPAFKPLDAADHHMYLQHDFKMIKEGPYKGYFSCFNDGGGPNVSYTSASVPILKFDFKSKTVKMVHHFTFPSIYSMGRGNVDFVGDYMLVNFGLQMAKFKSGMAGEKYEYANPSWVIKNIVTDKLVAEYFLPNADNSYNIWIIKDSQISQPSINFQNNKASIDATVWSSPLWSTGDKSYSVEPPKNGTYFVSVNGGGLFRLVSDPVQPTLH